MLAVLLIEMKWYKNDRTPAGAVLRKQFYTPKEIDEGVDLSGSGIFYKQCYYCQSGDYVITNEGVADSFKSRCFFYSLDDLNIPCIAISEESENSYRIKWYDNGQGMPRRKGGNEDFHKKGARFAGQPNILNETAFVLEEGKSGLLKYNYRYTSYEGQWYKCYYVYIVNEKKLTYDIFLRDYDYEYDQLADLF